MSQPGAWAILVALVFLILANLAMLVHSIARAPCKFTAACRQLVSKVFRRGGRRHDESLMLLYVRNKMFRAWIGRARALFWYASIFTSLSNLPVLLMHGLSRGEDGSLQTANFGSQDLVMVLVLAFCTFFARCPRLVTVQSLGPLYLAFFSLLVAFWLCREEATRNFQLISILFLNRLAIAWIYNSIGFTVGCNAVWLLAVFLRPPLEVQPESSDDVSVRIFTMQTFLVAEVVFFVTLVTVCLGWRHSLWAGFWMEAQARSFDSETAAVGELLHATCDVVVELQADLSLAGDSPRFSALMMRGGKQGFADASILHFIPNAEDRQRLQDRLSAPCPDRMSIAGALHVQMRDSIGNSFDMELFHVSFEGFDGSMKHLVGMREFTDMPLPPLRSEQHRPAGALLADGLTNRKEFQHNSEEVGVAGVAATSSGTTAATTATATASATATPPRETAREATGATGPVGSGPSLIPWPTGRDGPPGGLASGAGNWGGLGERPIQWLSLSDSSSCSSVGDVFEPSLILPHFKPTTGQAMAVSLLHTLMTWNFDVPAAACCPMHAALVTGKRQLAEMAARPCTSSAYWEAIRDFDQCGKCGILGDLEDWGGPKCLVCKSNPQVESL